MNVIFLEEIFALFLTQHNMLCTIVSNTRYIVLLLQGENLMKCPFCGSLEHRVIDKRECNSANSTRRRRKCTACEKRFTTYEVVELNNLMVVKKNGNRENFDRNKIRQGILKAVEKRPVSAEEVDSMTDSVEAAIRRNYDKELESAEIGNLLMEELKQVDQVAYIRFASVYKNFEDVETFAKEIKKLHNH